MLWELLPVQKPVCLSRATTHIFAIFAVFISVNSSFLYQKTAQKRAPDGPAWDAVGCGGTRGTRGMRRDACDGWGVKLTAE